MDASPAADSDNSSPRAIPRRAVAGWVLYDLANTIYMMGVISLTFPLWVRDAVGEARADTVYGTISAVSMALIFVASPLLGAMTDRARKRMPFLIVSTVICVTGTALLARAGFWVTAVLFVLANVAYQAGSQFYDALLPEVSTEDNRGRIGGVGVGVGYLGSYVAVGLSLWFAHESKGFVFFMIGLAFLLFSLPCFLFVRERGNPRPQPINFKMAVASTKETIRTLRSGGQYPGLLRFLVGRVFYTDAINTVINVMALFTVNVAISMGLDQPDGERQAKFILMFAITFAIAGGFVWGWLTDAWGPKLCLNLVLGSWMIIFVLAGLVGILGWPIGVMYGVAAAAGFSLGGVWAADRPYMLRLTPPWRIGEFYGLYGMVGRFAAITGPLVWAVSTHLAHRFLVPQPDPVLATLQDKAAAARTAQGIGVFVLLGLVLLSFWILRNVSDERRDWSELKR